MGSFDSLRYRDYRLIWTGAFLSNVGTWMQAIALNWYVFLLTHSAFWVSFVTFINFMPTVVSPIGGAYSDRYDRKLILLVTQSFMLADAAALAILVWLHHGSLLWVLLLTFGLGLAVGFNNPTWMAFVPSLVPPESLVNAIALNSAQFSLARVIGPAVAGAMIALTGAALVFGLNAISFVAVLVALVMVSSRHVPRATQTRVRELLVSGLRYTWRDPRLRAVIGAIGVSSFFAAPVSALLPIFAAKVYGGGSGAYGALAAAMGLGSVIGALGVARLGNRVSPVLVAISLTLVGVLLLLFAAIANFVAGLILMLLYGAGYLVAISSTNGDIQLHVEESMRGRVLSLYFLSFGALFPLGSLVAGAVAAAVGVRWTTGVGAAVCVAWGARLYLRFRGPAAAAHGVPALEPG
jgi:MFS family permease